MKTEQVTLRYLPITARKVRLIANTLKGLPVKEAEAQLLLRPQRAAESLLKLLRSAQANAKNKGSMNPDQMVIAQILVDGGPVLKRSLPRAQGRATPLLHRMSHVTIRFTEAQKAVSQRFVIAAPEKKKKEEKPEKKKKVTGNVAPKPEASHKDHEKSKDIPAKPKQEGGMFKRFFRRKSV